MGAGGLWEKKPKELFYAAGIAAAACLAGILAARVGKGWLSGSFETVFGQYFNQIITLNLDYGGMFFFILWKNSKRFVIFWLAQMTIFGIPLIAVSFLIAGFAGGFFCTAVLTQYKAGGILIIGAYLLPQAFFYVPAIVMCLKNGFRLASAVSGRGAGPGAPKLLIAGGYLKPIGLSFLLLLLGAAAECFAGTFLLKKVLEMLL